MRNTATTFQLRAKRSVLLCSGILLIAAVTGCTTTSHMSQPQPVALNSNPSNMSELHIAEVALSSGDVNMATTIYERVARSNPKSIPALTGLGNTLYAVGDFTRAGVYFDRASQIDPDATEPKIGMARVAIHQRRLGDAADIYRKLLVKAPNNPLAASGLGVALDMDGKHAEAQAVLRAALAANPGDPALSVNLGLSLVMGGDPQQGANVLLDVTRYPSAPAQARQDLALAFGLSGNTDAAGQVLAADLPKDQVADNLRFYAAQRALMFPNKAMAATGGSVSAAASSDAAVSPVTSTMVAATAIPAAAQNTRAMAVLPALRTPELSGGASLLTHQTLLVQ